MTASLVFEDGHLLVFDKPPGQHTQPTPRGDEGSLLGQARRRWGKSVRIVHRLDRDASGLVVLARSKEAAAALSEAFRTHAIRRTYRATVAIPLPLGTCGTIDAPLRWAGGRCWVEASGAKAVTHWEVVGCEGAFAELEVRLETGRMHQIRVHLAHALGPIVGDRKYGGARAEHLMLRAVRLELSHPVGGQALVFEVPYLLASAG